MEVCSQKLKSLTKIIEDENQLKNAFNCSDEKNKEDDNYEYDLNLS